MASRNYGMAFDTPYNEKLLGVLEKYDRERDTNGEPMYFESSMEGGAFLGADGRVVSSRNHPHLSHPLMGAMNREMAGGMTAREMFGRVGDALAPPYVRRIGYSLAKDLGKVALEEGKKEATKRGREYVQERMSGGTRPPGTVSPFVHPPDGSHMVAPGTMGTYPMYNAVEMRSINGGFFGPALMAVGRIAGPAIASAIATAAIKKATGGSAVCASCEGAQTGGAKKRGRPKGSKKGGSILDAKFSVNDIKNTGRELLGMGILDEKFSINDVKNTGRELLGLGVKKRGRPKGSKNGGNVIGDVGRAIGKVGKKVGSVALPIAKDIAVDVAKSAIQSYLTGSTKTGKGAGVGVMKKMKGAGVSSGGAMDGRKRRAEAVKKVMKEKGMKMIEASKYVKQHGLY